MVVHRGGIHLKKVVRTATLSSKEDRSGGEKQLSAVVKGKDR